MVIPLSLKGQNFTFTYDRLGASGISIYPKGSILESEVPENALPTTIPITTLQPETTVKPYYSIGRCYETAKAYFLNLNWKNPSSVIIHGYDTTFDEDSYTFWIDYSAQNGFGGYNRETYVIKISKETLEILLAFKL